MSSRASVAYFYNSNLSGTSYIDSLFFGNKWGGTIGTGASVTYSFASRSSNYSTDSYGRYPSSNEEPWNGFSSFTSTQKAAAQNAMNAWSEFSNISFNYVTDGFFDAGDIRFANSSVPDTAWAYYPSSLDLGGDIWFSHDSDYNTSIKGTYGYMSYMHEIGHAIGLKHPDDVRGTGGTLSSALDSTHKTIMSYQSFIGDTNDGYTQDFYPTGPMLYDIAAVQYLYGANYSTRNGNTTYSWNRGEQILETIWDGGGTDTIDWSNQSSAAVINLNEGEWSELGPAYFNGQSNEAETLAIAYGATIENAKGGSGNDIIIGNYVGNFLYGNMGNDKLVGNNGNDSLNGGNGNDKMYGGAGNDKYWVNSSTDAVFEYSAEGVDKIYSTATFTLKDYVENLALQGSASIHGYGNDLANIMEGNGIANRLVGYGGDDKLIGGGGADTLDGGIGSDILLGGSGADYLDGGSGRDRAQYSESTSGLTVDLQNSNLNTGDAAGDIYADIENVYGSLHKDKILGDSGDNAIWGWDGNDKLYGRAGADFLSGGNGNDILLGSSGADCLDGGSGRDRVQYSDARASVKADLQNSDLNTGDAAGDTYVSIENVYGTLYNDKILGDNGDNAIWGWDGKDKLYGRAGADFLSGGNGNDILLGSSGADYLDGGSGSDRVQFSDASASVKADLQNSDLNTGDAAGDIYVSIENVFGSLYNDKLLGDSGDNAIWGWDGNDKLYGRNGADYLNGGDGDDILLGGENADYLDGGSGRDRAQYSDSAFGLTVDLQNSKFNTGDATGDIYVDIENVYGSLHKDKILGDSGDNAIWGWDGNDKLYGRAGSDYLSGGLGDDVLLGGGGADNLDGGSGRDRAQYSDSNSGLTIDLQNFGVNTGDGSGDTYSSIEDLFGSLYSDNLAGDIGDNTIWGWNGNDVLYGRAGDDTLYGNSGNDTFVFGDVTEGTNTIADLEAGDIVDLEAIFSSLGLTSGYLANAGDGSNENGDGDNWQIQGDDAHLILTDNVNTTTIIFSDLGSQAEIDDMILNSFNII